MKEFFKMMMATVAGLLLTGLIVSVVGILLLVVIVSVGSQPTASVKKGSVLVLSLEGELHEQGRVDPLSLLLGDDYNKTGLNDLIAAIDCAEKDDRVEGIYLKAGILSASPAQLQELRQRLQRFQYKSGKFIVAYADDYTQGTYYLCSVADKVVMNPSGQIAWRGLSSQVMYYKETLDKLGVEMQVFKVGAYKSAVEPFLTTQMSDANKEQLQEFLETVWNEMTESISESRDIDVDSLNAYADHLAMFQESKRYVEQGMVDALMYRLDMKDYLEQQLPSGKELNLISVDDLLSTRSPGKKAKHHIVIYYAEGEIDGLNDFSQEGIHSPKVCRDLRKLAEDESVDGIVFRINSPGGSAYASEQIWNELNEMILKKPVVVSMSGEAASGGYYISSAALRIFAQPTTLTGSIGIYGMVPNLQKLSEEKLGLHIGTVNTNKHSDVGNLLRPFDTEERAAMQSYIERGYQLFLERCAVHGNRTVAEIDSVAGGRVWSGRKALYLKLVDDWGGLQDAVEWMANTMKWGDDYDCEEQPVQEDLWMSILNAKENLMNAKVRESMGDYYPTLQFLRHLQEKDRIQMRLPFDLQLNL